MTKIRLIGLLQLAAAAVALAVGALIAWNGYGRWVGISHIGAARLRMVDAYDESVRRHAVAAASELPNEAAAVLLDIDLTREADYARLEKLEKACAPADRELVRLAKAMSLVLRGQPAPDLPGSDGALLGSYAALAKGGKPGPLALSKDHPPHQALMNLVYVAQLRAALAANDRALARDAAGTLALLTPAPPDGPRFDFICGALDPAYPPKLLTGMVQRIGSASGLPDLAHRLSAMAPDRAQILDAVALGISPDQPAAALLEAQVRAAGGSGTDLVALARRCFDAARPDLAKLLLPKLPAEAQGPFRSLVLNQEGDVAALAKLGDAMPALAPRVTTPRCRPGLIAFHLSNDLGMVPKSAVTIRIEGNDVPPASVMRSGTLFSVEIPNSGVVQLDVRAGDRTIFAGKVTL